MTVIDVHSHIQDGLFEPLYIFTGEEFGILNIYIDKIANRFDNVYKANSIAEIYKKLTAKSLFDSGGRSLYIIRDDPVFLSDEKYWKDLTFLLSKKNIFMIFKYSDLSKATKFKSTFSDNIVIFDKVSENVLKKYIKERVDLPDGWCKYLITVCGRDYSRIMLEVDKLLNLCEAKSIKAKDAMPELVESNLIYANIDGTTYDLVDAIMMYDVDSIKRNLELFKAREDNPMYLFALLHVAAKSLLQIQLCGDKDISKVTGLNQFQVKSNKKYVGTFNNQQLVRLIRMIKYCEESIKNGTIEQDMAVDYLVVNIV